MAESDKMPYEDLLNYKTGKIFTKLEPRVRAYHEAKTMLALLTLGRKLDRLKG